MQQNPTTFDQVFFCQPQLLIDPLIGGAGAKAIDGDDRAFALVIADPAFPAKGDAGLS